MAATLEPTAVLCEASNQPGQPSAAFRDKLALFKSNSLQVGSWICLISEIHKVLFSTCFLQS